MVKVKGCYWSHIAENWRSIVMYGIDNELTGQLRYRELLKEAEQERLAAHAKQVEQGSFYRNVVYLVGSSLIQLGQRLERVGTSCTSNSPTSASIRQS